MATSTGSEAERPPNFKEQGEQIGVGLSDPVVLQRFGMGLLSGIQQAVAWIVEYFLKTAGPIAVFFAKAIARGEDKADPVFRELASVAIQDLMGIQGSDSKATIGKQLLNAMTGGPGAGEGGEISPSLSGAEAYMSMVANLTFEGYLESALFEGLTAGYLSKFGELDDALERTLGIGRTTRAVLRPILNARVITPTQWAVNRTYRPMLLSPSEVARQVARGRWTREKGIEELARQGWSNDRIELLLSVADKTFSPSDVRTFVGRGHWTRDQGISHLKDQGWTEQGALDALRLEGLRTFEQLETSEANAIIGAYANRTIDRAQFGGLLSDLVQVDSERALFTEKGELLRTLNVKRLSISQVEAMVKSEVLNVLDYRNAARREGYPEDEVSALELHLRWEMNKDKELADHRAEMVAQRETERQQRVAAAAARRAELEAERVKQQRGPIAKLERAAVRGLIPLSRVEEVLRQDYDAETVATLIDLIEADREDYLAQQQRANDAGKRTAARGLSIGEAQAAVMANVLTLPEFRARLLAMELDPADVDVLVATLAARKADQDAATKLRDASRTEAAGRRIDLARFEQLVRRGARTLPQYSAQLAELGYDEADRAAMAELLQLQILDDAAARAERDAAKATLEQRGLSLDQFERAVILGVKTLDEYAAFLLAQRFTADAQMAMIALLRDRVDEANAARARRQATPSATGRRTLALATVRRAAQLGIISPNVYVSRLIEDGYGNDDIQIELELLVTEIADVQAQRQRREQLERDARTRNVSLAQVEQAVKRGLASLEDYRARAAAAGYSGADLDLLVSLLDDELAQQRDARDRREEIARELAERELNLGQLEDAVKKGFKTVDEYYADVTALGYGADDAGLLTALLVADLEAAAPTSEE